MQEFLSDLYWDERYKQKQTGWDLGRVSPPLKAYFDQLENIDLKILIPGCGSGYEGTYLFDKGFKNVHILDFAQSVIDDFKRRHPEFPDKNIHHSDFFNFEGQFDLIIEQTLFCAIDPKLRAQYAQKVASLLNPKGKLVGLFFNRTFIGGPPFGGSKDEYIKIFESYFSNISMETAFNSIEPRKGTELFVFLSNKI